MGALGAMVRKDLRRRLRSPFALILWTAFPLLLSGIIALTFASQADGVPKVRLLVEDRDGGLLGNLLMGALESEQSAEFLDVSAVAEGEGAGLMEKGKASALLVLPEGFTEDVLFGNETTLQLVRNPAEGIMPEIAEQLATTMTDLASAASRVLRAPLDELAPLLEAEDAPPDDAIATISVAFNQVAARAGQYVFPPAITLETVQLEDPDAPEESLPPVTGFGLIFLMFLPGMAVYSLFLLGDACMRDIVTEGPEGTLRRQLAGPVGAGTVVVGKALLTAIVSTACLVILSIIGLLVAKGAVSLPGFLLVALGLIASVTGFASLIYGLARNDRQAQTVSSILYLFMAFVGGTFIQLDSLPSVMRAISPYTPFFWATDGFTKLIRYGAGPDEVLLNAGVLLLIGAVFLPVGARLLHRRILRGATS